MSTIAERMATAFEKVTGLPVNPPEDWMISTNGYTVTMTNMPVSCRYLFKAGRVIRDGSGHVMAAESKTECTSIADMVNAMRNADRCARVLAGVSDRLTEDGWEIDPLVDDKGFGITAKRAGIEVLVYSNGEVVSSDLMAETCACAVVADVDSELN